MTAPGIIETDVEIGFVADSPIGSFPTVKVITGGIKPLDPVGLIVTSDPVDGPDKGAHPTWSYPIELAANNPAQHADANGDWAYGPQRATDLFPDGLKRTISAKVIAVIGEASATAQFEPAS
jgi:hypothetical protein